MIETYMGKWVNPLDMKVEDVDIYDIAHALSLAPRFAGHTPKLYSVAEHSVNVALILRGWKCTPNVQLEGLLHDGSEAYICDLPRPIKDMMPEYREIERRLQDTIYERFELKGHSLSVQQADQYCLEWDLKVRRYTGGQLTSEQAEDEFLYFYFELLRA
jgi:5'-deoxynucleotidase YfbR-like HD superfamily hydrolase